MCKYIYLYIHMYLTFQCDAFKYDMYEYLTFSDKIIFGIHGLNLKTIIYFSFFLSFETVFVSVCGGGRQGGLCVKGTERCPEGGKWRMGKGVIQLKPFWVLSM